MTDENVYWRFRNKHEPLGEFGESLWQSVFVESGMFYVPLKDLPLVNRKGPRMQGNDTILPDFDVTTGRRRAYVDSKCKSRPVAFRNAGNELRHGIDRKCHEAYDAIGGLNRQTVILAVCELFDEDEIGWSGTLLAQTFGQLGEPVSGFSNQDHMVYWPRRKFEVIASALSPSRLWGMAKSGDDCGSEIKARISAVFDKREPAIQGRMF